MKTLPLPQYNPDMLAALRARRSNLAKLMDGPGPSEAQLTDLLDIAARVPDHRKLAPWRFIVIEGEARETLGQHLSAIFLAENPGMPIDRSIFEGARFLRAPMVITVVSSPVECPRGTPEWEQILSAGAVCYNLLLAAQGHGFAAQWLTEWYAYHAAFQKTLGLQGSERIAGFVCIGTTNTPPTERARPDVSQLMTRFS